MPQVSDVRPTSHDRHDPMLVAALAADDLAGTERDQAIALTRTCADCATLHDDLLALAHATAAAPPPVATRPRDFQLTPADAARLRPNGWRRFVAAISASRSAVTRPLGAGLATIGIVGLLIGNVSIGSLSFGSSSAAAPAGGAPEGGQSRAAASAGTADTAAGAAASSAGPAALPIELPAASQPAASTDSRLNASNHGGATGPSGLPGAQAGVPLAPLQLESADATASDANGPFETRDPATNEPFRPLNVLFGAAIVVGLGLLVASRRWGRRPA